MLVLRRGKRQSVVIGDQITVTVEDLKDTVQGERLFGATVGLGFEMPRSISVYRKELKATRTPGPRCGKPAPRKHQQPGELVELSDVAVQLRIELPPKIPIRHRGESLVGTDGLTENGVATSVYRVTCHKEDRVTICNNIVIAALDFRRFVARETAPIRS